MKKEIIIFLITYIMASLIRGLIASYTGFSFNFFQDRFEAIPFLIDSTIWILTYIIVRLIVSKLIKKKSVDASV